MAENINETAAESNVGLKKLLACCPHCDRDWPHDSEQAACIRLFGECIVCRVNREKVGELDGEEIGVAEIQAERMRFIAAS